MIKLKKFITIYMDNVKNFNLNQCQVVTNIGSIKKVNKFIKN